ncbi:MAG: HAD family hydrolase [Moraxellaceae bacterium]|nr:HAD family hydrolase [Moraxellaceae bacterium]
MTLALFDLDNTLIAGDSDHAWGQFLVDRGVVDADAYQRANDQFYQDYRAGTLDIVAYSEFVFAVLARNDEATLLAWREAFIQERIEQTLLPKAFDLLQYHRGQGHTLVIITATNRFVTELIAQRLGVDHLIATEPERDGSGHFTGKLAGVPCFQAGKITRLHAWLDEHQANLEGAWFYSDSRNDLPLLEAVTHPVVVDADPVLAKIAEERGWPALSLRD